MPRKVNQAPPFAVSIVRMLEQDAKCVASGSPQAFDEFADFFANIETILAEAEIPQFGHANSVRLTLKMAKPTAEHCSEVVTALPSAIETLVDSPSGPLDRFTDGWEFTLEYALSGDSSATSETAAVAQADAETLAGSPQTKRLTNNQNVGQCIPEDSHPQLDQPDNSIGPAEAAERINDDDIRTVIEQLIKLSSLAEGNQDQPVETLKEANEAVKALRAAAGRQLASVFNQWEGMRWEDMDTSRDIASAMDEIATSLGLKFSFVDSNGVERLGSLRCGVAGRDRAPTFRYECAENGRHTVRRASRELMTSDLVPQPAHTRRGKRS